MWKVTVPAGVPPAALPRTVAESTILPPAPNVELPVTLAAVLIELPAAVMSTHSAVLTVVTLSDELPE